MNQLKVSEAFVKEAYSAACPAWRQKMEKEFPDLFSVSMEKIEQFDEYATFRAECRINSDVIALSSDKTRIKIALPSANTEWTIAAWNLAIRIIREFPEFFPKNLDHRWILLVSIPGVSSVDF